MFQRDLTLTANIDMNFEKRKTSEEQRRPINYIEIKFQDYKPINLQ